MHAAITPGNHARAEVGRRDVRHRSHADVQQRHVYVLSPAGGLPVVKRGDDRDYCVMGGHQIDHGDTDSLRDGTRHVLGLAGYAHQSAQRLSNRVVAGARRVRAGLTEAGDRAIYDVRACLPELPVGKSVTRKRTGLEILDEHVAFLGQLAHQVLSFAAGDVHGDRLLAAIGAGEICRLDGVVALRILDVRGTPPSRVVTRAGPFDLDHFRAKIGERLSRHRTGQNTGQVEHADSCQRSSHG